MGSNATVSVVVWPGLSVIGNPVPGIVNPAPVRVAALIVTGKEPEDVRVTDRVAEVLTGTAPKATLVALMLNVAIAAFNCRVKFFVTPPALAVIVTACAVATEEILAVNEALVEFAGTVTELGTVASELLLDRFTATPLCAAAVRVTVHASVPDPVIDPLLHDSALNSAEPVPGEPVLLAPVPLKLITCGAVVKELFAIANCPVAVPAAVGLN